jgi:hypothetical protein
MRPVRLFVAVLLIFTVFFPAVAADSAASTSARELQLRGLVQVSAKGGVVPFLFLNGDVAAYPPLYGYVDRWSRGRWRPMSEHLLAQGFSVQTDGYSKPGKIWGVTIVDVGLPNMAPGGKVASAFWMPRNLLRVGVRYRLRTSKDGTNIDASTAWEFTAKDVRPFEVVQVGAFAIVPATSNTPSYVSSECVDVVRVRLGDSPKVVSRWLDVPGRWEPVVTVSSPDDCSKLVPGVYKFPEGGGFGSFVVV